MSEQDKIQDPAELKNSEPAPDQPTSELLQNMLDSLPTETVTVDYLMQQLAHRSFGGLIILLGIVAVVPGISLFAGLALLLPGMQMLLGFSAPRLPTLLRQRSIDRKQLQTFGNRIMPWLQQLERRIRPRWLLLTDQVMTRLIGALVVVLGLVSILPFPLVNILPALAVVMLSLGLLQRDGMMVLAGLVCSGLAILVGAIVLKMAFNSLALLL